jgi:hypothetical protein
MEHSEQNTPGPTGPRTVRKHEPLPIVAAGMISFGVTLLIMTVAYVRDLELLSQVPQSIWLFVCGVPTDNEMTLPFMVSIAVLGMLAGAGILVFYRVRRTRSMHASQA